MYIEKYFKIYCFALCNMVKISSLLATILANKCGMYVYWLQLVLVVLKINVMDIECMKLNTVIMLLPREWYS